MCGKQPTHLHHKITRARGGLILDEAGETYHLMHLCAEHHDYAHDNPNAMKGGLLLPGFVVTGPDGKPMYLGTDAYLSQTYPYVKVAS